MSKIDDLIRQIEELSATKDLPSVEELDGWIPFDADKWSVYAAKEVDGISATKVMAPVGFWKKVHEVYFKRDELLRELNTEAAKTDPAMLVPEDTKISAPPESTAEKGIHDSSIEKQTPEHGDPTFFRTAVAEERSFAKRLQSIARQYHDRKITKKEALEKGRAAIETHYKVMRSHSLAKFQRETKAEISSLPPEAEHRFEKMEKERLDEFQSCVEDIQALHSK